MKNLLVVSPFKSFFLAKNPGPEETIEVLIASDAKLIFYVSTSVGVNG